MHLTTKSGKKIHLNSDKEEAEIQGGINSDLDTFEVEDLTNLRKRGRPFSEETKDRINIRLSKDVTTYFRATGKGWQTRINDALKAYVAAHK